MKQFAYIVLLLGLLLPSQANGQQTWKINGQVRHRLEVDDKDFISDKKPITFNLLRTRLGLQVTPFENTLGFIQLQDSRTFGEARSTLAGKAPNFDLHQGYFKLIDLFGAPIDLQVGRFEANYSNQRLIGAVAWHNVGRSFDGVRATVHPGESKVDLFNFKETAQRQPGNEGDRNVLGAYGDLQIVKGFVTQPFIIWQRSVPQESLSRYTAGLYFNGTSHFKPEIEIAYQGGKKDSLDVSAFLVAVNLGYTFAASTLAPGISVGIDYLSGDNDDSDGSFKVFDTLYGTNHKFYGLMDYFLNIPRDTFGKGLRDIHVKATLKPADKLQLLLAYHHFGANEDVELSDGSTSKQFGNEVDVVLRFTYNKQVAFQGGGGVFAPGTVFSDLKGSDLGGWLYLMTAVNL